MSDIMQVFPERRVGVYIVTPMPEMTRVSVAERAFHHVSKNMVNRKCYDFGEANPAKRRSEFRKSPYQIVAYKWPGGYYDQTVQRKHLKQHGCVGARIEDGLLLWSQHKNVVAERGRLIITPESLFGVSENDRSFAVMMRTATDYDQLVLRPRRLEIPADSLILVVEANGDPPS